MTTEATETTDTTATETTGGDAANASLLGAKEGGEQAATAAEGAEQPNAEPSSAADKPAGAPEKYEFVAPEGHEVDQERLTGFEDMAREIGLSQDQFNKVVEYGLKDFQDQLGRQAEQHFARERGWRDAALGDASLSDGKTLLPEVMTNAGKVFDQYGGDDLRKALVETGAGNHPAVIRALNQIGKAMGAAESPDVGKPASEKRGGSFEDIASRMYGKGS